MSIHCLFCGSPENWCEHKEYEFDDTLCFIVVPDEESPKKERLMTYYCHSRCLRKVLKMGERKLLSDGELHDFEELKQFTAKRKKEAREE